MSSTKHFLRVCCCNSSEFSLRNTEAEKAAVRVWIKPEDKQKSTWVQFFSDGENWRGIRTPKVKVKHSGTSQFVRTNCSPA